MATRQEHAKKIAKQKAKGTQTKVLKLYYRYVQR